MRIELNGEPRDTEADTLLSLWVEATAPEDPAVRRGFAVALNGALVRAPAWDATRLDEGDRVEIVRAFAGG